MKKTLFTTSRLTLFYKGLTMLSLIALVLFVALPLEFRVMFGHWPRPYFDDPGGIPFLRYQVIACVHLLIVAFSLIPVWICTTVIIWKRKLLSRHARWMAIATVVLSWVMLFGLPRLFPMVPKWIMD